MGWQPQTKMEIPFLFRFRESDSMERRIIWRPGGLRRSTDFYWDRLEGWTGFFKNVRMIEEPNPLTKILKSYIHSGYIAMVGNHPDPIDNHRDIYEHILYQSECSTDRVVMMHFAPEGGPYKFVGKNWLGLLPDGRMTPHQTWIVASSPEIGGITSVREVDD